MKSAKLWNLAKFIKIEVGNSNASVNKENKPLKTPTNATLEKKLCQNQSYS